MPSKTVRKHFINILVILIFSFMVGCIVTTNSGPFYTNEERAAAIELVEASIAKDGLENTLENTRVGLENSMGFPKKLDNSSTWVGVESNVDTLKFVYEVDDSITEISSSRKLLISKWVCNDPVSSTLIKHGATIRAEFKYADNSWVGSTSTSYCK